MKGTYPWRTGEVADGIGKTVCVYRLHIAKIRILIIVNCQRFLKILWLLVMPVIIRLYIL